MVLLRLSIVLTRGGGIPNVQPMLAAQRQLNHSLATRVLTPMPVRAFMFQANKPQLIGWRSPIVWVDQTR